MISICQPLRMCQELYINSHWSLSPVTESHLIDEKTDFKAVTCLNSEKECWESNPHLPAGKGPRGWEANVCPHVTLAEVSGMQVRTREPLRTTRCLWGTGCLLGVLWSLGPWHGSSGGRGPPFHLNAQEMLLCLSIPVTQPCQQCWCHLPSFQEVPKTWLFLLISQELCPEWKAHFRQPACPQRSHRWDNKGPLCPSAFRWLSPPAEITHSTFWLYELII